MKDYIFESASKSLNNRKEFYLLSGQIPVYMLAKLAFNIDISKVLKIVEDNVPASIISLIDGIYVGNFKDLEERNIQAMYSDGAIYLSPFEDVVGASEELVASNIAHELAHALEENFGYEIYADEKIRKEYDGKKKKLFHLLNSEGFALPKKFIFDERYVDELDMFLYNEVGYDNLAVLVPGLFTSPYSVTSMREYFANGMEDYLLGDVSHLKQICPVLYGKLKKIIDVLESEEA